MATQTTTTDLLAEIGVRARTLEECLESAVCPAASPDAAAPRAGGLAAARLTAWGAALAPRDPGAALHHRLTWDGIAGRNLSAALGPGPVDAGATDVSGWLNTLAEVLDTAQGDGDAAPPPLLDSRGEPWPFGELLRPFLQVARTRLAGAAATSGIKLGAGVWAEAEAHLLRQCLSQAGQAFYEHFSAFRARLTPPGSAAGESGDRVYRLFVRSLFNPGGGGGLANLFLEYSALARSLVRLVEHWARNLSNLLTRLGADRTAIVEQFLGPGHGDDAPGDLTAVRPGLSDPHHGGQTVAILEFSSGLRLVYKPKDLGHEAAAHALLRSMRAGGLGEETPPALRVLPRPGYGWVEFIAPSPCETPAELACYHRRAGVLLALVHALGGDDCHLQNVVATRHGPVLVDVESLLRPPLEAWAGGVPAAGARAASSSKAGRTVLHTGLLPVARGDAGGGGGGDVSGFRGRPGGPGRSRRLRWRQVNTDAMELDWETPPGAPAENLPTFAGQPAPPEPHLAEMLDGFTRGYRFLLEHRAALLAPDSPLAALAGQESRLIFRPTQIYARLLQNLSAPAAGRTGIERSLGIEALARAFVSAPARPFFWPLLGLERTALEAGDVPMFNAGAVAGALGVPPADFILDPAALLADLDEADLRYQRDLTRAAFLEIRDWQPLAADSLPPPELSRDELIAAAVALGHQITSDAGARPCPGVAPWRLYDGALGVALFLAALERVAGGGEHHERIAEVRRRVDASLDDADNGNGGAANPETDSLGAGMGWGGAVYGLAALGRMTGNARCLELSARAARQITPGRIAADRFFEPLSGGAGAIFGLLALHGINGDPLLLDRARQCGRRLVAASQPGPNGGRAWPAPTAAGQMLAGFAHGAAGIACALLRLHAVCPEPEFLETARAAMAYERTVFLPEHGNWPYVRGDASPALPAGQSPTLFHTWCHGAPSIALARIAGLGALDEPEIRAEIEVALATTLRLRLPLPALDHVCCGNLGRVGILHFAAVRLGRPELLTRAHAWAALAVRRASARDGGYRLEPPGAASAAPPEAGFFRGLAGIGYELLRLAAPGTLPAALCWE